MIEWSIDYWLLIRRDKDGGASLLVPWHFPGALALGRNGSKGEWTEYEKRIMSMV